MIFASDLDRTLIYSQNALNEEGYDQTPIKIETYPGGSSHLSTETWKLLKTIWPQFIPVTTRIARQYFRIKWPEEMSPHRAIISNGAEIYLNNQLDAQWENHLKKKLKDSLEIQEFVQEFLGLFAAEWLLKPTIADGYFFYSLVDRKLLTTETQNRIQLFCQERNYTFSLQGKKIYAVPEAISKGNALEYLKDQIPHNNIITAGDSLLDLPLIEKGNPGFVLTHGELEHSDEYLTGAHFHRVEIKGIKASEYILKQIITAPM